MLRSKKTLGYKRGIKGEALLGGSRLFQWQVIISYNEAVISYSRIVFSNNNLYYSKVIIIFAIEFQELP